MIQNVPSCASGATGVKSDGSSLTSAGAVGNSVSRVFSEDRDESFRSQHTMHTPPMLVEMVDMAASQSSSAQPRRNDKRTSSTPSYPMMGRISTDDAPALYSTALSSMPGADLNQSGTGESARLAETSGREVLDPMSPQSIAENDLPGYSHDLPGC